MIKINISYQDESELTPILALLQPVMSSYKVKKSKGETPYKHIYIIPKKPQNHNI